MQIIAQSTVDTKAQSPVEPKPNVLVEGGGVVLGGAVLWAVISKLLERFGNTAIDARQKEIDQKLEQQKQDLLQQRELFDYFKEESAKDSSTLNEALKQTSRQLHDIAQIFVTKELDNSAQYKDLYYALLERQKKVEDELAIANNQLVVLQSALKDIFNVLSMRERQNKG